MIKIHREDQTVHDLVATMQVWRVLFINTILGVLILLWGSWSDRHRRRKQCILIPMIGNLFASIGFICCTYFEQISVEVTIAVEIVCTAFSGGFYLFGTGVFSYVADLSTEKNRSFRIGILSIFVSLAAFFGTFSQTLLQ